MSCNILIVNKVQNTMLSLKNIVTEGIFHIGTIDNVSLHYVHLMPLTVRARNTWYQVSTKNSTKTRHSPDKGRNKTKNNQCWWTFILNFAIYPGVCVIFPQRDPPLSCVLLSVYPRNHFWCAGSPAPAALQGPHTRLLTHAQTAQASKCVQSEVWGPQGPPGGTVTKQELDTFNNAMFKEDDTCTHLEWKQLTQRGSYVLHYNHYHSQDNEECSLLYIM